MRNHLLLSISFIFAGMLLLSAKPAKPAPPQDRSAQSPHEPWKSSQLITPTALEKWLKGPRGPKPTIVCVGFRNLYFAAHVLGARYIGPASQHAGIERLDRWARRLPKDTPIVIYCGCCPMDECPNIRPAFQVLRSEGLTHLWVLDLPDNLASNWVMKGYPTQRAK
jgi:thiosulfate/3-mercaptopyruvate sulfurtransferase